MRRRRYLSVCAAAVASVTAGCSNGGSDDGGSQSIDNELLVERIRGVLEQAGAEIHELTDEGDLVTLEYSPGGLSEDASDSEIEARVEETVRSVSEEFYQPIVGPGSGWEADRLDASVTVDGTVVATYYLKTAWAEECSGTGDTASCIEERVQDSVERPYATDEPEETEGIDETEETDETEGN